MFIFKLANTELSAEGEVKGQEEKKKKPIGLIVGAVFAILFVFAFIGILGSSVAEDTSSSTPAISEEEYKASCEKISYSDLARNPDTYKGKKVVFTGKVIQVLESGSNGGYRVNVTRGSYGIWTDTIWMTTKIDTNNRILEDDVITIYGESTGIYTYETVMGNELSIPSVKGVYVYLNE